MPKQTKNDKQQYENDTIYCNKTYHYTIKYPSDLLGGQDKPDARDGQVFLSKDGKNELCVYARYNVLEKSFDDILKEIPNPKPMPQEIILFRKELHPVELYRLVMASDDC